VWKAIEAKTRKIGVRKTKEREKKGKKGKK